MARADLLLRVEHTGLLGVLYRTDAPGVPLIGRHRADAVHQLEGLSGLHHLGALQHRQPL